MNPSDIKNIDNMVDDYPWQNQPAYCPKSWDCDDEAEQFHSWCMNNNKKYPYPVGCFRLNIFCKGGHALNIVCSGGTCCVVEPQWHPPRHVPGACWPHSGSGIPKIPSQVEHYVCGYFGLGTQGHDSQISPKSMPDKTDIPSSWCSHNRNSRGECLTCCYQKGSMAPQIPDANNNWLQDCLHFCKDKFKPAYDPNKQVASCQGYCGGQAPSGCWCDGKCNEHGDCCSDQNQVCSMQGSFNPPPGPSATCQGFCGAQAPSGCWCDDKCTENGDCCPDRSQVCGGGSWDSGGPGSANGSCAGFCGSSNKMPGDCYCDFDCSQYGDCCSDYFQNCA
jgi:hypothetical protein